MSLASTIMRAPVDRRSTREAAYLAATLPSAIGAFMLALAALAACLALVVGVGLPLLVGVLALARESGTLFRRPARATLGWTWSTPAPPAFRGRVRRAGALLRDGDAWRSLLYCALKLPLTAVGVYGALIGYVVGALGATYPLWWIVAHGASWPYGHRPWTGTWPLALQGAALLLIVPWFVRLVVTIDHALINRLLAPNRAQARISALEESRATLAEDATATLQRIERDLHDGTQARLVALGVALSRLEARVSDPEVEAIVATARQQVLDALEELREIIRGVHPPALDDGLSTALATLAARSPVPVELQDELNSKPTDVVAAALYFTAAELLTNVARHAEADRARVEIHDDADRIWLVVRDDGHGGASLSSYGTGLAGVERRLRALDGTMSVDSPPNGPTIITVTLPRGA
ncbi:MAG TPA: sensor domain-containing protein [Ilumatobacter sp.]|jgi:signal transduction histidine kinase|nr:sensor domain-containing protein [Ilumatobacter sp.]